MEPIHELLNRIHWDPEFGKGDFEIGFLDKIEHEIIRVALKKITFVPGDHYFFHYMDSEGREHSVPLHRIKDVFKDGVRIWHRDH
jgi:uncharacterized protein (UPF0248 family)